ncbi:MAG: M3 family oligoendopeptidase [Pseudomonadales bacterium]|jgi:oligoendopeptidase F|nr:M3 family oligoendopeptidase [Pseudomonadales bacterium]MDP6471875.1 M3 family oligoendopeptidase [Pseudomonadales bacterium]MDP6826855.1 M3 family oligoendopeptidase [Pseudomonadales bacterium]MDP6970867.1 M3 family oligoendopeptidase [Pseudomonadales bacterium]|tara:strand:- start:598 stop:2424 length:1827 start_codon:yes stop_codon:yes gene_type:complete
MREAAVQGPAWDLSDEYSEPGDPAIAADLQRCSELMDEIEARGTELDGEDTAASVKAAQQSYKLGEEAERLLANVYVFASCLLSVDSRDAAALELMGSLQNLQGRIGEVMEPLSQFTDLAEQEVIDAYLSDPEVALSAFQVNHSRKRRHELLNLGEEKLVHGLSQDGIHAWGNLYDQLSGTIRCEVTLGNEKRELGLAEASSLLSRADTQLRREAWRGMNEAWSVHEESCAAAVNAIAGWRLEMCKKRSASQEVHYLDAPVHMNRINRTTLDTLMEVAREGQPLARRAALLQARAYGEPGVGPWDVRAPAPRLDADEGATPFAEAVQLIADAYAEADAEMGAFVRMMIDKRWVEGTVGANKRPGAYCTGFAKSRTPRVYMTYTGEDSDIITLAHELGHAFHSWVMRDLPDSQRSYGMSLAETASTFGETLVRDALLGKARTPAQRLTIAWEEMAALVSFILNIPARFTFEQRFYEKRKARPLRAQELKDLMSEAWQEWYGEALTEPDPMFWANKLHFYISGISFYNFPYLFGYLFSSGVYHRRARMGSAFYPRYVALLRDTGRMTAEDLAAKHLEVSLEEPDFWRETLSSMEARVDAFEGLLDELALQ